MTIKRIQKALEDALLRGSPMDQDLYYFELEELMDDLRTSLRHDKDAYLFAVTEKNNAVAMILIKKSGKIYINEEARTRLQELWPLAYELNLRKLIPLFARQLRQGEIPINGVKVVKAT